MEVAASEERQRGAETPSAYESRAGEAGCTSEEREKDTALTPESEQQVDDECK